MFPKLRTLLASSCLPLVLLLSVPAATGATIPAVAKNVTGVPGATSLVATVPQELTDGWTCIGGFKTNNPYLMTASAFGWRIILYQPIGVDLPGRECGDRVLEAVKRQGGCEVPTWWGCDPAWTANGTLVGIGVHFDTTIFCGTAQIEQAIREATEPSVFLKCENRRGP